MKQMATSVLRLAMLLVLSFHWGSVSCSLAPRKHLPPCNLFSSTTDVKPCGPLVDPGTVRRADGLGMRKLQGTDSVQAVDSTSSTKSVDSTTAAQKADKADLGISYAQAAAMAMGGGLGPQAFPGAGPMGYGGYMGGYAAAAAAQAAAMGHFGGGMGGGYANAHAAAMGGYGGMGGGYTGASASAGTMANGLTYANAGSRSVGPGSVSTAKASSASINIGGLLTISGSTAESTSHSYGKKLLSLAKKTVSSHKSHDTRKLLRGNLQH